MSVGGGILLCRTLQWAGAAQEAHGNGVGCIHRGNALGMRAVMVGLADQLEGPGGGTRIGGYVRALGADPPGRGSLHLVSAFLGFLGWGGV